MKIKKRQKKPTLPSTVTELDTEDGSKVYVVGTAHFSDSSKKDVVKVNTRWEPFGRMFTMLSGYHYIEGSPALTWFCNLQTLFFPISCWRAISAVA